MAKERVDLLVYQQGLSTSREQAKRLIMAGQVYDEDDQRYDKAGEKVDLDTVFHLKGASPDYVSRGGLKLKRAQEVFGIDFSDQIVLDIGASTGGFTDLALQEGAQLVYALDVGYNQLAYSLRQDPRVVVMERKNFRYAKPEDFQAGQPSLATIDVSFISLALILEPLADIIKPGGPVVALIKPQFEAGPNRVGKKGIIRDPQVHQEVLIEVADFIQELGYTILQTSYSPIKGGEGNIEFLAHLKAEPPVTAYPQKALISLVNQAHQDLK